MYSKWVSPPLFCNAYNNNFSYLTNSKWVTLPFLLPGSSHPMAKSKWMTLHFPLQYSGSYFPWPTGSEWCCHSGFLLGNLIPWQTACGWNCPVFLPGSLFTLHPIIVSEWECLFFPLDSPFTFCHDLQEVSNMPFFLLGSLIASHLMTNRRWVKQPCFLPGNLILSHDSDQQFVSGNLPYFYHTVSSHMYHAITNSW